MDIPINADVTCHDGRVGKSSHIIVDSVTKKVSAFVVQTDQPKVEHVVPVEMIDYSAEEYIGLNSYKEDVYRLPVFHETHFKGHHDYDAEPPIPSSGVDASHIRYQPHRVAESGAPNLPSSSATLTLNRGAKVLATDGKVGTVDELVIDPETHMVTYLVLRQHFLLLNKWIVTIPVSDIERADTDTVVLRIDKAAVEALPSVDLKVLPWD